MKKSLFLLTGATLLIASSCSKLDDGYQEVTRTINGPAVSIITDLDNNSVIASYGNYAYDLKMTETSNTGFVTSPELIANNVSLAFISDTQNYLSTGYDAYFTNVKADAGNTSMPINNASILALYIQDNEFNKYGYYINTDNAAKYTYTINSISPWITVAKYNIGDSYRVNTFPLNSFFKGVTTTTYPMGDKVASNETQDITYRFILDVEKNTAVMIIYNSKFSASPMEPVKTIIVENLAVEFTPTAIKITGKDIVPDIVEGSSSTPNEDFILNSVEFTTTDNIYTLAKLDFTVADKYTGHFEGSYLNSYYLPK